MPFRCHTHSARNDLKKHEEIPARLGVAAYTPGGRFNRYERAILAAPVPSTSSRPF